VIWEWIFVKVVHDHAYVASRPPTWRQFLGCDLYLLQNQNKVGKINGHIETDHLTRRIICYNTLRGDFFVCYITHAQTNAYNIPQVMTKFKILVFRYVSQSANKLKKYV
jgi:hypothetical protein